MKKKRKDNQPYALPSGNHKTPCIFEKFDLIIAEKNFWFQELLLVFSEAFVVSVLSSDVFFTLTAPINALP